jgi:hypothetical protein
MLKDTVECPAPTAWTGAQELPPRALDRSVESPPTGFQDGLKAPQFRVTD